MFVEEVFIFINFLFIFIIDPLKRSSLQKIQQSFIVHGPKDLPSTSNETSNDKLVPVISNIFNSSHKMSQGSSFNFTKKCPERKGFEESLMHNKNRYGYEEIDQCTPMEVDTNLDETAMSDVHTPFSVSKTNADNGDISEHKNKVSKLVIAPVKPKTETKKSVINGQIIKSTMIKYIKVSAMFLIPIFCAIILMRTDFFPNDDLSSDHFNAENITDALRDLVYGQDEVLAKLKDSFLHVDDTKLIVFTGGIGVGKTHTANIIANNFPWSDNVVKIVSPQYKNTYQEMKFIRDLSKFGYNLIIMDSLEFKDRKSVIPFVTKVFHSNRKAIILLIFTVPEYNIDMSLETDMNLETASDGISAEFSNAKLEHSLIVFNQLTEEIVRKCIRYALAKKGLIINQYNIEHILQNVNYKYSGCKGVYSKVALLQ